MKSCVAEMLRERGKEFYCSVALSQWEYLESRLEVHETYGMLNRVVHVVLD